MKFTVPTSEQGDFNVENNQASFETHFDHDLFTQPAGMQVPPNFGNGPRMPEEPNTGGLEMPYAGSEPEGYLVPPNSFQSMCSSQSTSPKANLKNIKNQFAEQLVDPLFKRLEESPGNKYDVNTFRCLCGHKSNYASCGPPTDSTSSAIIHFLSPPVVPATGKGTGTGTGNYQPPRVETESKPGTASNLNMEKPERGKGKSPDCEAKLGARETPSLLARAGALERDRVERYRSILPALDRDGNLSGVRDDNCHYSLDQIPKSTSINSGYYYSDTFADNFTEDVDLEKPTTEYTEYKSAKQLMPIAEKILRGVESTMGLKRVHGNGKLDAEKEPFLEEKLQQAKARTDFDTLKHDHTICLCLLEEDLVAVRQENELLRDRMDRLEKEIGEVRLNNAQNLRYTKIQQAAQMGLMVNSERNLADDIRKLSLNESANNDHISFLQHHLNDLQAEFSMLRREFDSVVDSLRLGDADSYWEEILEPEYTRHGETRGPVGNSARDSIP